MLQSPTLPRSIRVAMAALLAVSTFVPPTPAQVFDSDNVVLLSRLDLFPGYNDVWGFVGNDAKEYIIQGLTTGTAWWDVSDPVNPVLVKVIGGPTSGWRDMFVIGDYCYVGTEGGGGIQVIDISDPTDPTLVNVYDATVSRTHNIFGDVSRELIFTAGGYSSGANGGIQVLDVSDPFNISEIGRWTNQYVHDLSADGNYLYACLIQVGKLRILDLTDPTNPVNFGSNFNDPDGGVHASWPLGNGTHVVIAEENGGGHVKSLDISDEFNITIADADNPAPAASAHNVHVQGDKMYVSWYARGTRIYDISEPTNMFEIGFFDTYPASDGGGVGPGNWGVYPHLPSGVIAASDRPNGMFLMRYEPDAAAMQGTVFSSAGGTIDGASAEYVNLSNSMVTDATGAYRFTAFPGAGHKIRFSAFGFDPDSITVSLAADEVATNNVTLTKLPAGGIGGTVTDAISGLPVEAVEVTLVGSPLTEITGASGFFSFPDVPSDSYALKATRYGYAIPQDIAVVVQTGIQGIQDIELEPAANFTDFSDPSGWTVVDTPAPGTPDGSWEFGEPFGTFANGVPVQAQDDHTLDPEDQCAVTGNASQGAPSADDVDFLTTQLLSPVYNLSAMLEPHVFYYRWYSVTPGDSEWLVEATGDGGQSWVTIETSAITEPFWRGVDVDLTGLLSSYGSVQFRFTAEDVNDDQIVEGAVDDFSIYDALGSAVDAPHIPEPGAKVALTLAQNRPNPSRGETTIAFSLPEETYVELSVFDVRGARVAVLVDAILPAGVHEAPWDGQTFTGSQASDGVYFYKLTTPREVRTRKLIRLSSTTR